MKIDKHSLKKEITIVLVFKVVAILLLWQLFFSHPIKDQLTAKKVAAHFIAK